MKKLLSIVLVGLFAVPLAFAGQHDHIPQEDLNGYPSLYDKDVAVRPYTKKMQKVMNEIEDIKRMRDDEKRNAWWRNELTQFACFFAMVLFLVNFM